MGTGFLGCRWRGIFEVDDAPRRGSFEDGGRDQQGLRRSRAREDSLWLSGGRRGVQSVWIAEEIMTDAHRDICQQAAALNIGVTCKGGGDSI